MDFYFKMASEGPRRHGHMKIRVTGKKFLVEHDLLMSTHYDVGTGKKMAAVIELTVYSFSFVCSINSFFSVGV